FKGTTLEPRYGNELPRIAETPSGMLNSVGLQNPGIEEVIRTELPELRKRFHKPLIANLSGFSKYEYRTLAERMAKEEQIGILEINISCPNVHAGGMAFGTDPAAAAEITRTVKEVSGDKPVYMKLTPNAPDITEVALACEEAGADGISMINTVLGMRIDTRKRAPLLANRTGGLSGPAIFPIAIRMVYQTAKQVHIPIIGMGGIRRAEDVIEMMMAGASAVEVGAANLADPFTCPRIIRNLPRVMKELGIEKLTDIIGTAL
ncbi:MAG: dihydroorotate dehydrogenase, partial [Eubacteriales bacterium]|nr:dihydroorotate dehydrogenase [Eubacteriales bacterium]